MLFDGITLFFIPSVPKLFQETKHILGHFFHGLKFCAHGPFAPAVQEPSCDGGIFELPEPLEVLPQGGDRRTPSVTSFPDRLHVRERDVFFLSFMSL